MMKRFFASLIIGVIAAAFAVEDAEAQRRLGGGRNIGKQSQQLQQRQATPQQQAATPAREQANAAQQPASAGAATARPNPLKGALLGLAAGLGLAALAAYLGLSETLTAVLMAVLVALAVVAIVGFVLRRMRGQALRPAYPGADAAHGTAYAPESEPAPIPGPLQRDAVRSLPAVRPGSAFDEFMGGRAATLRQPWGVPADFDTAAFLEQAKKHFQRLQTAWSRGDLAELEEFTSPEMFVALTHELNARGSVSDAEVVTLDAELLGIETTAQEYVASVRFSGTLRVGGEIEQVDEVWNLTKPVQGPGGWVLAGIQQLSN